MNSRVFFKFSDGSIDVFNDSVDLDYFNIRQWRLLYFRFCELQKKDSLVVLVITPISYLCEYTPVNTQLSLQINIQDKKL